MIRRGHGYEGEVLYFLDDKDNVIGLLKKKTAWYILLRSLREIVTHMVSDYEKKSDSFDQGNVETYL